MLSVSKSPWFLHYDGSSCNGCDIEVLACLTPLYDVERFGVINTGNPKHADIFLITGGINAQNKPVVEEIYSQMPNPKVGVAVGICACKAVFLKSVIIFSEAWIQPSRWIFMSQDVQPARKLLLMGWAKQSPGSMNRENR